MKKASILLFTLSLSAQSAPVDLEIVKQFARGKVITSNLKEIYKKKMDSAYLKEVPWTSSYLPGIRGFSAESYADGGTNILSFKPNYRRFKRSQKKFKEGKLELDAETIKNLSPADKYDLLVGNFKADTSLARNLFEQANFLKDRFGMMTFWTGMCHGWSPAAISWPAPKKTIYVKSVGGNYLIPFYPNDIKALISTAFANNTKIYSGNTDKRIQTRTSPHQWSEKNAMPIHGYSCRKKRPKVDENGRAVIPENADKSNCEDVNAAFWHLTMVNLLGVHQQGLVVDIDHNETVNNHPTKGFKVKYFNPLTGEDGSIFKSIVRASKFPDDIRLDYRHPNTKYIVGVAMEVEFVDYKFFNSKNATDTNLQKYKKREFIYDLEIDTNYNIIGGEWKSKKINDVRRSFLGIRRAGEKPDFLWYAPKGMKAVAYDEGLATGEWKVGQALPKSWATAAQAASIEENLDYSSDPDAEGRLPYRPQPEPIFKIVETLLKLSR